MCGELRPSDAGKRATLLGWVNRRRDLGNLIFIDLRDRTGITQIVFNNELNAALQERAGTLRSEYVIGVTGTVKKRQENTVSGQDVIDESQPSGQPIPWTQHKGVMRLDDLDRVPLAVGVIEAHEPSGQEKCGEEQRHYF